MQRILTRLNTFVPQKSSKVKNSFVRPLSTVNAPTESGTKVKENNALSEDSTWLLLDKYLVYQMCRFPVFVKNARRLTEVSAKIFGKKLVNFIIEKTIGKVFTAGGTLDDLSKEMDSLIQKKVYSVADLSIEDVGDASKEYLDANKEQNVDILKAIGNNPRHTMSLKVTALINRPALRELNVAQKKLYDMFVEIAGYDLDAAITKSQVKSYLQTKFGMYVTDEEIDEFFKVGKTDSKDTDPQRLTAVEYAMNIHAYPIYDSLKTTLSTKLASLDEKTITDLNEWVQRINAILESVKRAEVLYTHIL